MISRIGYWDLFFFFKKEFGEKNKNILGIQFCQGNKISKTQTQHTPWLKHQVNIIIRTETGFDREALLLNCFYTTGTIYK